MLPFHRRGVRVLPFAVGRRRGNDVEVIPLGPRIRERERREREERERRPEPPRPAA